MTRRRKTHVIFDLDGTLLDTEPLYTQAAQAVVGRFGKVYDWSVKRLVIGGHPLTGAQKIVEQLGLPLTAEAYLDEREQWMRELCRSVQPMPGALRLVEQLAALQVPMGIGTSSQRHLCEVKLRAQRFVQHMACVVCSDDPEVRHAKPAPDIFLEVARRLGTAPQHCIVLEDTPNGVRAARAAGMDVIAVVDPNMRGEDYGGALAVLETLESCTAELLGLTQVP